MLCAGGVVVEIVNCVIRIMVLCSLCGHHFCSQLILIVVVECLKL